MERTDVETTLREVERVRLSTRQSLNPIWFANLALGVFFLGATLMGAVAADSWGLLVYWIAGGALAVGVVVRHYAGTERKLGLESRAWDASGTIFVAIVAGIVLLNLFTDGDAWAAAPFYVGAAGKLLYAAGYRDPVEAAAGAAIAIVTTALLLAEPSNLGLWCQLGLGLVLVAAGIAGRLRARA